MLANELVDLQKEVQTALFSTDAPSVAQEQEVGRVEHLGNGVYVQYGVHAIENDPEEGKTATITHDESRSCVYHELDAL